MLARLSNEAESDGQSEAADTMLQQLSGPPNSMRGCAAVHEIVKHILEVRDRVLIILALQEARKYRRWSFERWQSWFANAPRPCERMNDAMQVLKENLIAPEMHQTTRNQIDASRTNNARRDIERKSFRAWQKSKYVRSCQFGKSVPRRSRRHPLPLGRIHKVTRIR